MQLCISASLVKLIRMPGSCLSMAICKENKLLFYYLKTSRCKHNTMYGTLQKKFPPSSRTFASSSRWFANCSWTCIKYRHKRIWMMFLSAMHSFVSKFTKCYEYLREQVHEVLWIASWASSRSVTNSFVSKFTKCFEQLREHWSSRTIMSSFTSSWTVTT